MSVCVSVSEGLLIVMMIISVFIEFTSRHLANTVHMCTLSLSE